MLLIVLSVSYLVWALVCTAMLEKRWSSPSSGGFPATYMNVSLILGLAMMTLQLAANVDSDYDWFVQMLVPSALASLWNLVSLYTVLNCHQRFWATPMSFMHGGAIVCLSLLFRAAILPLVCSPGAVILDDDRVFVSCSAFQFAWLAYSSACQIFEHHLERRRIINASLLMRRPQAALDAQQSAVCLARSTQ